MRGVVGRVLSHSRALGEGLQGDVMTTPSPDARTLEQIAAGIAFDERGRWWNSLTDLRRWTLSRDKSAMLEEAFLAGVMAGLRSKK